jgi:hypothetical protein
MDEVVEKNYKALFLNEAFDVLHCEKTLNRKLTLFP